MSNLIRIKMYQRQWGDSIMTYIVNTEKKRIKETIDYHKKHEGVFKYKILN